MQKVLVILGLVVFLAVVEQTTGQVCSLNYCRNPRTRSNCKCRGCCMGKLGFRYGRCEPRWFFRPIWSCFCYRFRPPPPPPSPTGPQAAAAPVNNGSSKSNDTGPSGTTIPPV